MSLPGSELPHAILFCRLCQSLYRQPRTLPCLHSFCHDCLQQLAPSHDSQGQAALLCPICSQKAPMSSAGVSDFLSNQFLARICQEYVGEVGKTLVSTRPLSPTAGQGPISPASLITGRGFVGRFQYPSTSEVQTAVTGDPARPLSPTQSSTWQHSTVGRQSSTGVSSILQAPAKPRPSVVESCLPSGHSMTPRRHSSSSSSSSEAVIQTARRLSAEAVSSRGVSVQRRLSSTPRDVVRIWECLHRKLNNLQAASLQVTYSLENVNMLESNWHQRRQDLTRDIQRRSAQLQFFVKRQERLLLAALDSRHVDDSFTSVAEVARSSLRANLKSLMHETDVLKTVLDLATDSEFMSLSSLLLSSSVSQLPVTMEAPDLHFEVPELSMEDMVGKDFGCLTSKPVTHTIFTPEDIDHKLPEDSEEDDVVSDTYVVDNTSVNDVASSTNSDNLDDIAYIDEEDDEEEVIVEETFEIIDGKMQMVSKSRKPVSQTQFGSHARSSQTENPAGTSVNPSKDQGARGRGTETRRTANSSPAIGPTKSKVISSSGEAESEEKRKAAPGTSSTQQGAELHCTMDKFQQVRETLKQKRRELLLNPSVFTLPRHPEVAHLIQREKRVRSLDRSPMQREQGVRPISPPSHQLCQGPLVTAPVHIPHKPTSDIVDQATAGGDAEPMPGTSTSNDFSTERNSRPVRRAISAASDRASKMEYLRESWRRRRELLVQKDAFITTPQTTLQEPAQAALEQSAQPEDDKEDVPLTSDNKFKIKQSLKNTFSNLKQALKKNGKAEEEKYVPHSPQKGQGKSEEYVTQAHGPKETAPVYPEETAAEQKVLRTVDTILQKKSIQIQEPRMSLPPQSSAQSSLPNSSPSPTSPAAKPSMLVKPRPREPSPALPTVAFTSSPLETLPEDEGKTTAAPEQRAGLRVSSPVPHEANKEKIQQVRANIRRKKERWRSLSLT